MVYNYEEIFSYIRKMITIREIILLALFLYLIIGFIYINLFKEDNK